MLQTVLLEFPDMEAMVRTPIMERETQLASQVRLASKQPLSLNLNTVFQRKYRKAAAAAAAAAAVTATTTIQKYAY